MALGIEILLRLTTAEEEALRQNEELGLWAWWAVPVAILVIWMANNWRNLR